MVGADQRVSDGDGDRVDRRVAEEAEQRTGLGAERAEELLGQRAHLQVRTHDRGARSREEEEDAAAAESRLSRGLVLEERDLPGRPQTRPAFSFALRTPPPGRSSLAFVPANRRSSSSDLAAASAADDDGFALPPMACRSPTGSWEINRTETRVSTMYSEVRRDKKHRQAKKGAAKTNPVCAKGLGMANAPAPIRRLNTKAKDTSEDADAPSTPVRGPTFRAMSVSTPDEFTGKCWALGKMSFRGFSTIREKKKQACK